MRRALALMLGALAIAAPAASARERWDTRVLAIVGAPGFPAHAYVHPNGRIYEGTYVNPQGDTLPSRVLEYRADGTLLHSWTMTGQDLSAEHGVQVATSDARGRLVLLDHTPARALLLDRTTGEFLPYAGFPPVGGEAPVPNYAAWGPDGSLYVTDYAHGTIFRVSPGGGTAAPWLTDPQLSAVEFGTTGIALAADQRTLLIGQQTAPAAGNPFAGALFKVAIGADGRPGALQRIWRSGFMDLPDGFAIARSGRIYVAALGPNQITVLDPDGRERERFPQVPLLGDNGSSVPFDTLSSVAFLGTSLITASQSNPRGDASHWAIHDIAVGEEGLPELIPANAGLHGGEAATTVRERIALQVRPRRVRAGRRVRFTFRATATGEPVAGALIRFAGRSARTTAAGRARIVARLHRPGVRRAVATKPGLARGTARVVVVA